jgi:hypothetical protein
LEVEILIVTGVVGQRPDYRGSSMSGSVTTPKKASQSYGENTRKGLINIAMLGRWKVSVSAHLLGTDLSLMFKQGKNWVRLQVLYIIKQFWSTVISLIIISALVLHGGSKKPLLLEETTQFP